MNPGVHEMAERHMPPRREWYRTVYDYERAFHLWRVLRRDAQLNVAEAGARFQGLIDAAAADGKAFALHAKRMGWA